MRRKKLNKKVKVRKKKSPQRNTKSDKYKKWRKSVYARDGYSCRICGNDGRLNAHHIKPWSLFPNHRYKVTNGITLCLKCHEWVHIPGNKSQYLDLGDGAAS